MARLANALLITLLLNNCISTLLQLVFSPATPPEQNIRRQRVLAPDKENSENVANQSHKDTSNSCLILVNLQTIISVSCDFFHISKKLRLKQEK